MASENLEKALGRAVFDDNFRRKWLGDFDNQSDELDIADVRERIKAEHLLRDFEKYKIEKGSENKIEPGETKKDNNSQMMKNENSSDQKSLVENNKKIKMENLDQKSESSDKINDYVFSIFKQTLEDSRRFFKRILYIGYGILAAGIAFFSLAVLSGVGIFGSSVSITSTVIFGIIGAIVCAIYFLYDPARRVQLGFSNILKIEMIFMNFWDQVNFWRPYGNSNEDSKKKEASEQMHLAAKTSMEFLQEYLDSHKAMVSKIGSDFRNLYTGSQNTNPQESNQV